MDKRAMIHRMEKIEQEADAIIRNIDCTRGGSPEQEERLDRLWDEYEMIREDLAELAWEKSNR